MSEAPAEVEIVKELINPLTISKKTDQGGRGNLVSEIQGAKQLRNSTSETESQLNERQGNLLVRIKQKIHIPDKQTIELQAQLFEQRVRLDELPDSKKMIEAYYGKVAETPLTNQEKRDLLKPEVLSQLSTDEYIALWKRLNPHFLAHTTRQGFVDHRKNETSMDKSNTFNNVKENGFIGTMKDERQLRSLFAIWGLKDRDKTSVTMFLSTLGVLKQENESGAKDRLTAFFSTIPGASERYVDKTAVHFSSLCVGNAYYGAEVGNEIFYCFPTDVIASQYKFGLQGDFKGLTKSQSELIWDDVYVWPNTFEDPGIPVDSGIVFLPEDTPVDPETGSKYDSDVKIIDGKETRIMIENADLVNRYSEWVKTIYENSGIMKAAHDIFEKDKYASELDKVCFQELLSLGFKDDNRLRTLVLDITRKVFNTAQYDYLISKGNNMGITLVENKNNLIKELKEIMDDSPAKFKNAENTISAKKYWEDFFSKNQNLKPKHIIYYTGDPTDAVYKFQQENGIGAADTSKTEGQFLGFDDHFMIQHFGNPKVLEGKRELLELSNKIIEEHYSLK